MASGSTIGLAMASALLLGACSGSLADKLGLGKRAPDEFAVVKRQPLIIPPDYDLRPPDPNAPGPLAGRADARTRAALTGVPIEDRAQAGRPAPAGASAGEAVLIDRTTAVRTDPDVRARLAAEVGGPATVDAGLFEQLMSEEPAPGPDAAAGGAPPPAEPPTIVRRTSTPLEDL